METPKDTQVEWKMCLYKMKQLLQVISTKDMHNGHISKLPHEPEERHPMSWVSPSAAQSLVLGWRDKTSPLNNTPAHKETQNSALLESCKEMDSETTCSWTHNDPVIAERTVSRGPSPTLHLVGQEGRQGAWEQPLKHNVCWWDLSHLGERKQHKKVFCRI